MYCIHEIGKPDFELEEIYSLGISEALTSE